MNGLETPDRIPAFGHVLADYIAGLDHDKPTAAGTRFRHSDAGRCARALAYTALGQEPTNPATPSGLWQMNVGTYGHELIQAALVKKYGDAVQCEVVCVWSDGFDGSGHADALVVIEGRRVLVEVKTSGAFGWDKSVGVNRKSFKRSDPEGPKTGALIQGALNALALDCDELVIVMLSMENASVNLAERLGLTEVERFCATWTYPRSVWEPWAVAEKARVSKVLEQLDDGYLPERIALDDDMAPSVLNPDLAAPDWRCGYCVYRDRCTVDGPGTIALDSVAA